MTELENYSTITVSRDGATEWLSLNRPSALNTLNRELIDELASYFSGLKHRKSCRVVVMRGNGKAFCAGLDLGSTKGDAPPTIQNALQFQTDISDIMKDISRCPQPVIALLHGAVCGGGFALALASDIRIAATNCKMNAASINIGLTGCDMGSSYFLPRLVGGSVAAELLLTGRFIHADRAERVGLVSEVAEFENLEAAAEPYVKELLRASPLGLELTKQAYRLAIDAPNLETAMALEDRQQILVSKTDDFKEAVSAFFEKRDPDYKNQ